jgi:thiamine kinase-like enzyme
MSLTFNRYPREPIVTTEQLQQALDSLAAKKSKIKEEILAKKLLIKLLTKKLTTPERFLKITGGYSNHTYRIKDLVLRFPKLTNPLVRNLAIEIHNLKLARSLNFSPLKVIAYYTQHNLLITQFIPNCQSLTPADFKDPKKIKAVAKLVKKLHYCSSQFKKNPETPLAFVDSQSKSFEKIKMILNEDDSVTLEKMTKVRDILKKFPAPTRPSHGDLHHSNLIELNAKIQLIDWEVSSLEDPAYDIARLFCVSDLNVPNRAVFLNHYQQAGKLILSDATLDSLKQRISLFEPINYFSIVLWARFELQFSQEHAKKLLEQTVLNYTRKTLETLDNLDLEPFNDKNYPFYKASEPQSQVSRIRFFSRFSPREANSPTTSTEASTLTY